MWGNEFVSLLMVGGRNGNVAVRTQYSKFTIGLGVMVGSRMVSQRVKYVTHLTLEHSSIKNVLCTTKEVVVKTKPKYLSVNQCTVE